MEVWLFLGIAAAGALVLASAILFDWLGDTDGLLDNLLPDHGFDGSPFLVKALFAFLTAFGSAGAIASALGLPLLPSMAIGLLSGSIFGLATFQLLRFVSTQEATITITPEDLPGRTAEVTVAIPGQGLGEVRCVVGQTTLTYLARSKDGAPIPKGTSVVIADADGSRVIVDWPRVPHEVGQASAR